MVVYFPHMNLRIPALPIQINQAEKQMIINAEILYFT